MRLIGPLLIILFVLLSKTQTLVIPQSTAPYIFYHSTVLNAIVIERADGTDSRTIGQGIMPADHSFVSGPGWSPSGRWFAWTSAQSIRCCPRPTRVWIVSADGTRRVDLLDDVTNVFGAYWSPTGDFLLVETQQASNTPRNKLFLVDMEQGKIIAALDNMSIDEAAYDTHWLQDGSGTLFYYYPVTIVNNEAVYGDIQTRVLYIDGHYEDNVDPDTLAPNIYSDSREDVYTETALSPDSRYIASSKTHTLADLQTGSSFRMRPFSGDQGPTCAYDWHPGSQWLMREDNLIMAGGGCYGGVSVLNVEGTISRELSQCQLEDGTCANWLPDRVRSYLAPGQSASVIPDPILTLQHDGLVLGVGWNRDGTVLATYEKLFDQNQDYPYRLHLWAYVGDLLYATRTFTVGECYDSLILTCRLSWNPSGTQIALASYASTQIVDINTGVTLLTSRDHFAGWIDDETPFLTKTVSAYDAPTQRVARVDEQAITLESLPNGEMLTWEGDERFNEIDGLAFVPHHNQIAMIVSAYDSPFDVYVRSLDTGVVTGLPKYGADYQNAITTTDDYIVAYGRSTLVHFWSVDDGQVVARLNRYASGVDFAPDGTFATASATVAEIWDVKTIIAMSHE